MKFLIAVSILVCSLACVLPSDFTEFSAVQQDAISGIQDAQKEHQRKVEELLADTTKTDDEILEGLEQINTERERIVKEIAEQTGQSVEDLIQVIQERTKAVAGVAGTLTGNAAIDLLLSTLLGIGGATYGVNKMRDKQRLARGEPVGVQPPTHT